ncbi:MAG: NAD(P)/FAD-dependent oxidoreductase, partial [Methylobacteriaceae bacterium]|nr:NAD(P)/FAD-dependent oxidoreductase [Methylobacteriaceae bacterium]
MTHYDVAIIGAGPAGMGAAEEAAKAGLSTLVLDEQSDPGGQIYRAIENVRNVFLVATDKDYAAGLPLTRAFRAADVTYIPDALVWNIDPALTLNYSVKGVPADASADYLIVASGAVERASPLPGWTLPGVTTVGALQILLKSHSLVNNDVVLVGSGPLMYVVACQMLDTGMPPRAIVETSGMSEIVKALPLLPEALRGGIGRLFKGLGLL